MGKSHNVRVCRRCGCRKTRVVDARQRNSIMWRTRQCHSCGNRWTTVEIDEWWFHNMLDAMNMAEGIVRKEGKQK